jgi:hypothetical protein
MILAVFNYFIVTLDTHVQCNKLFGSKYRNQCSHLEYLSIVGTIAFCITLFASSYIEEEHQFWYYWMQTMWIVSIILR